MIQPSSTPSIKPNICSKKLNTHMALGHGIEPWVTLVKDEPPLLDDVYLCFMLTVCLFRLSS